MKASDGWLQKFLERHNFRTRVPTTVCQKPPIDYAEKLIAFVIYVSKLREQKKYTEIFASDETAVWLNPGGGKCIEDKGAKQVKFYSYNGINIQ